MFLFSIFYRLNHGFDRILISTYLTTDRSLPNSQVMSKSNSGQEIGEAALFESAYRRHATTRCSQHCETLMCLDWNEGGFVFNANNACVFFRKWYGVLMDKKKTAPGWGWKKTHIKRIQLNIHEVHQIYIYIYIWYIWYYPIDTSHQWRARCFVYQL